MPRRLRLFIETLLVNALIASSLYQLVVYLANRRFWNQPPPPPADASPSVSMIVSLRGKSLDTLALLYVMILTAPTDDFELLLVLESDQDPAYPVAQRVVESNPTKARIIISGPANDRVVRIHNLNAGYEAARGDLVALVDATVHLNAEVWHAALTAFTDPSVGAVFAPPLVAEPEQHYAEPGTTGGEMLSALFVNHAQTALLPFAALRHRINAPLSGFIAIRRAALDEAGGLLHLLDRAADDAALGHLLRENGYRVVAIPVPATVVPEPETFNAATQHILRRLVLSRVTHLRDYLTWPFTNPLTVGFALSFITEREGQWWGRRTWWFFVWLRLAIAYELDRLRFGRGFHWTAYAQLFMLDTFIAPPLWARALVERIITWQGRTYRVNSQGQATPLQ